MIVGQSVALGPILPNDLGPLFVWGDDPALMRASEPYMPKNLARETEFWLNAHGDTSRVFFAIRRCGEAAIIGHVQITAIHPIHRSAVLGILIGDPADRGRGHGSEAMRLAIDFCWRHLNLRRVSLAVHEGNAPAIAVYEKLGFATEGVQRAAQFIDGAWVDVRMMALLRDEAPVLDRRAERAVMGVPIAAI